MVRIYFCSFRSRIRSDTREHSMMALTMTMAMTMMAMVDANSCKSTREVNDLIGHKGTLKDDIGDDNGNADNDI